MIPIKSKQLENIAIAMALFIFLLVFSLSNVELKILLIASMIYLLWYWIYKKYYV